MNLRVWMNLRGKREKNVICMNKFVGVDAHIDPKKEK